MRSRSTASRAALPPLLRARTAVALGAAVLAAALPGLSCARGKRPGQAITVTFWHGLESGVNNEVLEAKIAEFERRNPKITIDAQVYGAADQLGPKLDAAVAGGTPPDLLWWAPAFFPKYAEAGVLRELDDLMAEDPTFRKDDVYGFLWELGSFRGRIYASPFSVNNLAVYYNKGLFREAGIVELPRTWDELREAARRLTRPGVYGFEVPIGTSEWTVWTWQCFLWQAGGEILSPEGRAAFGSEAGVKALAFWRALIDDGSATFSETDAGYKTDSFLAGRTAMMINGPWNYPLLGSQSAVEFGAFPLPRGERAATNSGGESLFLFRSEPETERAAFAFMKFVMSPDFQVDWAMRSGYLPVSVSAMESARYRAFLAENPFLAVFAKQMPDGRVRPSIPRYPALSATLGKHLEAALYGRRSPKDALGRATAEVDELLR